MELLNSIAFLLRTKTNLVIEEEGEFCRL